MFSFSLLRAGMFLSSSRRLAHLGLFFFLSGLPSFLFSSLIFSSGLLTLHIINCIPDFPHFALSISTPSCPVLSHFAPCCPVPSHPIPSHSNPPHPIQTHLNASHPIPSYPIPSYPILSHHILSHPIPSHPIPSCPIPFHYILHTSTKRKVTPRYIAGRWGGETNK